MPCPSLLRKRKQIPVDAARWKQRQSFDQWNMAIHQRRHENIRWYGVQSKPDNFQRLPGEEMIKKQQCELFLLVLNMGYQERLT